METFTPKTKTFNPKAETFNPKTEMFNPTKETFTPKSSLNDNNTSMSWNITSTVVHNYILDIYRKDLAMANSTSRKINMTHSDLIVTCNVISSFMTRDLAEFSSYGIDMDVINAFRTKKSEFADMPTDIEVAVMKMEATDMKNKSAAELKTMLRSVMERARLAFGADDPRFSLFYTKDLSKMTDSELLIFGRMVKRSADFYATELLAAGLTPIMIAELDTMNNDLEDGFYAQRTAIVARDSATINRTEKVLELYGLLMSYCETGKVIWKEVNEAYYNGSSTVKNI